MRKGKKGETERKEKMEIKRKWEKWTSGMKESGGKFPPLLISSVEENQKRRKKRVEKSQTKEKKMEEIGYKREGKQGDKEREGGRKEKKVSTSL